jgi:mannose/fructose/N-acetylgalactosamine-specific phosphotransferase system component IIC
MPSEVFLFSLFGGLVLVDSKAAWQTLISQPLVACSIGGFILDDAQTGWWVGLIFQLPYLIELPIGAARLSFTNISAYVAAGVTVCVTKIYPANANVILFLACVFGFLLSYAGIPVRSWLRGVNLYLMHQADKAAAGPSLARIALLQYMGVVNTFFTGLLLCLIGVLLGEITVRLLVLKLAHSVELELVLFRPVILGAGVGAMLSHFANKATRNSIISGLVLGTAIFVFAKFFG